MEGIFEGITLAFIVLIVFVTLASPLLILFGGLFYYLKKRLEHKQIMTAIEKGAPLSELKPVKNTAPPGPAWIKNLTAGIACLIIAAAIVCLRLAYTWQVPAPSIDQTIVYLFIAVVFMAIGIARVLRGILQRKTEQKNISNGNNGVIDAPDESKPT
ncbi:MAG: hypothetical protein ACYTFK_12145 [Planctomycetota bacterium]|jgi:hypothetical protein